MAEKTQKPRKGQDPSKAKTHKIPKPFDPRKPLPGKPANPIPTGYVEPMAECESDCVSQAEQAACSPCGSCEVLCQTACEASCQSTCMLSCQTACQLNCQSGCEVDCQDGCQMTCQFSCEVGCQDYCETHCQASCLTCQSSCQLSCQTTCQLDCQSACQLDCQSYCENHCQATCEISCVYSCEVGCQDYCETHCQGTCLVSCQSTCELNCQTTCELSCQVGCEVTCTTGCEVNCTTGCEVSCTTGCEVTCTTGCEVSCQTTCELNCQTMCELGCQIGCEVSCEECVTCQAGCEVACTTGCEVACTIGCEIACTDCQVGCTAGCETACQSLCQAGCMTPCEAFCTGASAAALTGIKILVDAGHGGTDPGWDGTLNGAQVLEKDLTLGFALDLKASLESYADATVILTRDDDSTVSLVTRSQMGADNDVDGVVSIHFNGSSDPSVSGIETFYASSRESPPYVDREFAEAVHAGILGRLPFLTDRGVNAGTFELLAQPEGTGHMYPRCLVMVEYVTNPTAMEALDLPLAEASREAALGIARGVRSFFDQGTSQYREVTRTNCEGGTVVFNYAVCNPEHIDVLSSDTKETISEIMVTYPGTWQRASNCIYFNGAGDTVGYVLKSHVVVNQAILEGLEFDGWWVDDGDEDHFVQPADDFLDTVTLAECRRGFSVGPLLVLDGERASNVAERIQAVPYTGLWPENAYYPYNPNVPICRVGIGWARHQETDCIIHVFCKDGGCSLYDLQDFLMEFPGIEAAIAFDGGGSVGVIDKEIGTGVMGNNVREMKTAFVMTEKIPIPDGFPRKNVW